MTTWKPSRPRASLARRARNTLRAGLPALVWVGAVCLLFMLRDAAASPAAIRGIVDASRSTLCAPVDGRVAALLVDLHQEVEAGQVIARLDDADVRLKLLQATHELERIRADMALEQADVDLAARSSAAARGLEADVERRRLVSTVEAAQLAALGTRVELEEARVRVQGAEIEADRLTALAGQGMVGEPELVRVRTERDALHKRISELDALRLEHETRILAAQQRLREFAPEGVEALPPEAVIAPMRWRLKAQEAALERIALDARLLVLEAPMRGRIAELSTHGGEWVTAGRAIATIVAAEPRRILAYVPEAMRARLAGAARVEVARVDDSRLGVSEIASVSPAAVRLPERLWLDPNREEWGYEIVVRATGHEMPGERVRLALRP
ncbi:MAG: HlyD family efflux transporter periplasmic adaptor subunit [Planctomycetota bacterium]